MRTSEMSSRWRAPAALWDGVAEALRWLRNGALWASIEAKRRQVEVEFGRLSPAERAGWALGDREARHADGRRVYLLNDGRYHRYHNAADCDDADGYETIGDAMRGRW